MILIHISYILHHIVLEIKKGGLRGCLLHMNKIYSAISLMRHQQFASNQSQSRNSARNVQVSQLHWQVTSRKRARALTYVSDVIANVLKPAIRGGCGSGILDEDNVVTSVVRIDNRAQDTLCG